MPETAAKYSVKPEVEKVEVKLSPPIEAIAYIMLHGTRRSTRITLIYQINYSDGSYAYRARLRELGDTQALTTLPARYVTGTFTSKDFTQGVAGTFSACLSAEPKEPAENLACTPGAQKIHAETMARISILRGQNPAPGGVSIGSYSKGGRIYYKLTGPVPKTIKRHIGRAGPLLSEWRERIKVRNQITILSRELKDLENGIETD